MSVCVTPSPRVSERERGGKEREGERVRNIYATCTIHTHDAFTTRTMPGVTAMESKLIHYSK